MYIFLKWLVVALAGAGFTKIADTYLRPILPAQVQPEIELYPGKLLSLRTVWLVAISAIAAMVIIYVGKMLNIKFLKRKI